MKVACIMFFAFLSFCTCFAQSTIPNDSVNTGTDNAQMVFYQLSTGTKTSSSNTNWHLAITVRPTQFPNAPLGGTSIRINEANGVHAYYVPNADATQYSTLDTTGWHNWTMLHDADSIIDEGALNSNRGAGIFDFGWGVYNSVSHDVVGDSLYLIELPNGELKKFIIVDLDRDTAFNIKYSNIDNSDLQNIHISKADYLNKAFVYLNLLTNQVEDKEPLKTAWDLLFIKYAARDVTQGSIVPKVGVWANTNVNVGKARGDAAFYSMYMGNYSTMLNSIGWNWSSYDAQNDVYNVDDSLAFFIRDLQGMEYKLNFTSYAGPSTGVISFYKQNNNATGISSIEAAINVLAYPNPATDVLNIVATEADNNTTASIVDLNGKTIEILRLYEGLNTYTTAQLANGIYLLNIANTHSSVTKKLVIQR